MQQRNQSIDILKGIGIFLVLVAHSLGGMISHFAYTFHMPLFFIVTGLFISSPSSPVKAVMKDIKRLIVPAFFTTGVIAAVCGIWYIYPNSYLINPKELLWGGESYGWWDMNMLGNLWFLFALFFAKISFYAFSRISSKPFIVLIISTVIGAFAFIISRYIYLPFMVLRGLCVLPFVAIGYFIKSFCYKDGKLMFNSNSAKSLGTLSIVIWIAYLILCNEVVLNFSWGYVPDIIAACGGTLACYLVSDAICKYTKMTKAVLTTLGIYSLLLICGPTIETYCFPMQTIMPDMPGGFLFVIAGKVLWCVLFVVLCIRIPFLKKVFLR